MVQNSNSMRGKTIRKRMVRRSLSLQQLDSRKLLAGDAAPTLLDINEDGSLSANDALIAINEASLGTEQFDSDVNGDGIENTMDAASVIDALQVHTNDDNHDWVEETTDEFGAADSHVVSHDSEETNEPSVGIAASGISGPESGSSGPSGPSGPTGPSGSTGSTGPSGPSGPTGPSGTTGSTGSGEEWFQECGYVENAITLGYDGEWVNGDEVNGVNEPELGIAIFETTIPFDVYMGVSDCLGKADYRFEVFSNTAEGSELLYFEDVSIDPVADPLGEYYFTDEFAIPTGLLDGIELETRIYYLPPPHLVQQGGNPILKSAELLYEAVDDFRVAILDFVPDKFEEKGRAYAINELPRKLVGEMLGELISDQEAQQIIAEIQNTTGQTPEQATALFEQRKEQAMDVLGEPLKPAFSRMMDVLLEDTRPKADAKAGANDTAEPKSRYDELVTKVKDGNREFY